MARWTWLVVCGALGTTGAWAQDAEAPEAEAPRWSVGTGVGLGWSGGPATWSYAEPFTPFGGLGGLVELNRGLAPRASVEYRLDERLALTLDASASYARTSVSVYSARLTGTGASMGVGLRSVVAGRGPTRVSVHGQLQAGVARSEAVAFTAIPVGQGQPTAESVVRYDRVAARLAGGLAVERDLLDTLSVRLGADLVGAGFQRVKVTPAGGATSLDRSFVAELRFSPNLELRLAF